jgi:hypothetical protein
MTHYSLRKRDDLLPSKYDSTQSEPHRCYLRRLVLVGEEPFERHDCSRPVKEQPQLSYLPEIHPLLLTYLQCHQCLLDSRILSKPSP